MRTVEAPYRVYTRLLEDARIDLRNNVDHERGIVRGVKIIGLRSPNSHGHKKVEGTEYSLDGLREAIPMYEGAPVYTNHPDPDSIKPGKPRKARDIRDKVAELRNIRVTEGGLYGDMVLMRAHPMSGSILEAASDPMKHSFYCLSHNADGKVETRGKTLFVEGIHKVYSVDLVDRGATTKSLYESVEDTPMKITVKQLLEKESCDTRLTPKQRNVINRLLEQDDLPGMDAPMDLPEPAPDLAGDMPADPETALRDGFRQAVMACIDADEPVPAMMKKIKELLKAREQALGAVNGEGGGGENDDYSETEETEEANDSDSETDDDDEKKDKPMKESKENKKPQGIPLTEAEAQHWCRVAKVESTRRRVDLLMAQRGPVEALALLEEFQARATTPQQKGNSGPRSNARVPLTEAARSEEVRVPTDPKAWLKRVTIQPTIVAENN